MAVVVPHKIDWTYRNAILTLLAQDVIQAGGTVASLDPSAGETHPNWLPFLNEIIVATNALGGIPQLPTYSELDRNGFQAVVNSIAGVIRVQPPTNTTPPTCTVVTGGGAVGSILTCTPGQWTSSPTYVRQWLRNGNPINGAYGVTYTTTAPDGGANISCEITATNAAGSASAVSNAIAILGVPVNTVLPLITPSTGAVGDTLSTTTGTWTNSPSSYTINWQRNNSSITGATASTYVLQDADSGTTIRTVVLAMNASGAGIAVASSNNIAVV